MTSLILLLHLLSSSLVLSEAGEGPCPDLPVELIVTEKSEANVRATQNVAFAMGENLGPILECGTSRQLGAWGFRTLAYQGEFVAERETAYQFKLTFLVNPRLCDFIGDGPLTKEVSTDMQFTNSKGSPWFSAPMTLLVKIGDREFHSAFTFDRVNSKVGRVYRGEVTVYYPKNTEIKQTRFEMTAQLRTPAGYVSRGGRRFQLSVDISDEENPTISLD